ncbi:ABC transporter ATP-binding protein [Nocardiopsis composta]|uniref:Peptide/nickel transport system ATP-binding protein n=1 Tax=Nocardiopsis composta TaxID=157465 RepID=A0A7W8QHE4_9ACTN|nr:ATP-binding cassette domain-containing protein [Nocardiopsis composta]MBB5430513.1 peptide/nickel transport system ATP-binding protein [Nocardiopsis composta]
MTVLSIDDVHIGYGRGARRVHAVRGVTFEVAEGRACGVVGESGSGKSSLARAVAGLTRVDAGRITVHGGPPVPRPGPGGVRMVFQDPIRSLNPRRRLLDIVAEPLRIAGTPAAAAREAAGAMMRDVGMDPGDFGPRRPADISGGQAQRIAIARALVAEPSVLVADEPVSGLDISVQAGIVNLLHALTSERATALVFISHDLSVVQTLCDHVVVLHDGRIEEQGEVADVFGRPGTDYTRELVAAAPDF